MLLLVASAWALNPIPHAVAVHLSRSGLDRLGEGIAKLAPTHLSVGATAGELSCDAAQPENVLSYSLDGLDLGIHISDVEMRPSDGRLDLFLRGTLDSSRGSLTVSGDCSVLTDLAEVCAVELPATSLELHLGLSIAQVGSSFDATVDTVALDLSPIGNPLDGCLLSSAIGTLLGQNPNAITDLLLGLVGSSLGDLAPSIEQPLEDALNQLTLSTSVAVGSANVDIDLEPDVLQIDDNGLLLGVSATLSSDSVSDCVPPADPPPTDNAWPEFTGFAPDGALAYDAAALVNKQLVDNLLYIVWQSGALCLNVSDAGGLKLDTSLFGPVLGDDWNALFPTSQPITLAVSTSQPITSRFSANDAPIRVVTDGISLRTYAPLDGRSAKIFGVNLEGEIGLDLPYENGTLAPALVIDPSILHFGEEDHEMLAYGYSDGLAELVPTLLSSVLPADLLPSFAIPSYQGLGLGGLWWQPDASGQWLGGYAVLSVEKVEPIELPGCEGVSLGCDGGSVNYDWQSALGCDGGSGCSGGGCGDACSGGSACAVGRPKPRGGSPLPWMALGMVVWWRRRGRSCPVPPRGRRPSP